jgi:hypothetical protein
MRIVVGLVCCAIIASAVSFGWARQQMLADLHRQNAALQKRFAELERLKACRLEHAETPIDTNELQRLQGETDALMKLRAEIGRLHQIQRLVLPEIQQQVTNTLAQADVAKKSGDDLIAWREAELNSRDIAGDLSSLMHEVRSFAEHNGGKLPRSASDLESLASLAPPNRQSRILEHSQRLLQTFEFIPQDRELTTNDPVALLVREIKPRLLPDGSWARYYGGSGGGTDQVVAKAGDFAEYENAFQTGTLRQWLEKNGR